VEIRYEQRNEEESRYQSVIRNDAIALDVRNRFWESATLSSAITYDKEKGKSAEGTNNYALQSVELAETLNYYISSKYRVYARISMKYNKREGDFLSSLQEKRDGIVAKWNSTIDYRINNYTTAKFVYSGNSYPKEKETHQLELEVRAEF
jgi:hypothetical protein